MLSFWGWAPQPPYLHGPLTLDNNAEIFPRHISLSQIILSLDLLPHSQYLLSYFIPCIACHYIEFDSMHKICDTKSFRLQLNVQQMSPFLFANHFTTTMNATTIVHTLYNPWSRRHNHFLRPKLPIYQNNEVWCEDGLSTTLEIHCTETWQQSQLYVK